MIHAISFKGSVAQYIKTETYTPDGLQKSIMKIELPDTNKIEDKKTLETIKSTHLTDILYAEKLQNGGVKLRLQDASEIETFGDNFISETILKGQLETCSPHTNVTIERVWRLFSSGSELDTQIAKVNKFLIGLTNAWLSKVKK